MRHHSSALEVTSDDEIGPRFVLRAWVALVLGVCLIGVGFALLSLPSPGFYRIEAMCEEVGGLPPLRTTVYARRASFDPTKALIYSGTEEYRVFEKEDNEFKKVELAKGTRLARNESIGITRLPQANESSRGSKNLEIATLGTLNISGDLNLNASIAAKEELNRGMEIEIATGSGPSSLQILSESLVVRSPNGGYKTDRFKLPVRLESGNEYQMPVVLNLDNDESMTFDLAEQPDGSGKIVEGKLITPISPESQTTLELSGIDSIKVTNAAGETVTSSALAAKIAIHTCRDLSLGVSRVAEPSGQARVHIGFRGLLTSVDLNGAETLPTKLELLFTGNVKYSNPLMAIAVGVALLLFTIVQRAITVLMETFLPKPERK